jgi:5-methyltetrahydropteroyltriglutamate--homocysteine methyltransferase
MNRNHWHRLRLGTFAGREWVAEDVVWAKLKSAREGADIASQRLWGKRP